MELGPFQVFGVTCEDTSVRITFLAGCPVNNALQVTRYVRTLGCVDHPETMTVHRVPR